MAYKSLVKNIRENNLSKLYLFFGAEKYLINKGVEALKNRYFNSINDKNFNFNFFDGIKDNIDIMLNSCRTLPFMGEKRIVMVKAKDIFIGNKSSLTKDDEEKLIKYMPSLPETTCLVFIAGERIDKRKKLVKEINSNGRILEFKKLDKRTLMKWMQKIIDSNDKRIASRALEEIVDSLSYLDKNSNNTLYDVENELKKLCNYAADKSTIEASDIKKILSKPLENNIFLLVDAVADKDGNLALNIFNQMLTAGELEGRILYMIARQFKILNRVKLMAHRGYTAIAIAPKISLPQYIVRKYIKQANSFTGEELLDILNKIVEVEGKIKTGRMSPKLAIEMLITIFCLK